MEPLLGFKIFNTETDFINWQKETPRKICQVSPLIFSMGAEINETEKTVDAVVNAGCFVLYTVDV